MVVLTIFFGFFFYVNNTRFFFIGIYFFISYLTIIVDYKQQTLFLLSFFIIGNPSRHFVYITKKVVR